MLGARQRYERVPLEEENLSSNSIPHYLTGIPSTAPPSFHTIPLNETTPLPHRNDENAATVIPERLEWTLEQMQADDPPVSLWGASESMTTTRDKESTRDEILVRLLDSVERLEARLDERENEPDIEAQNPKRAQQWTASDICGAVAGGVSVVLFLVWFGAITILPVVAKYRYAGAVSAGTIPTSN